MGHFASYLPIFALFQPCIYRSRVLGAIHFFIWPYLQHWNLESIPCSVGTSSYKFSWGFHGEWQFSMENLLRPPVQAISDDVLFSPQKMVEPSQIPGYLGYPLVNIQKAMENHIFFIGKTMVFLWFIFHSTLLKYQSQWQFQDPKMEVLYHIRGYPLDGMSCFCTPEEYLQIPTVYILRNTTSLSPWESSPIFHGGTVTNMSYMTSTLWF